MAELHPPRRLALFAEQGHPESPFRSGVTRLTQNLIEGCRRHGVELDFFTYHREPGTDPDGHVRWHRIAPRLPVTIHGLTVDGLDLLPRPAAAYRRAARGRRYEVVLGTSPGIGTQGQCLARERGVPFAAVYTTDLPHYAEALAADLTRSVPAATPLAGPAAREGAWRYLRWLYHRGRTKLVLVPTETARRDLLARVPARAQVLGRGADTLVFPDVDRPERPRPRLLYVGRIDYGEKNLVVLERVMAQVDGVILTVVGDGDDLDRMRERLPVAAAPDRIRFTGRVHDQDRLRALYLEADVFIFPSLHDTLGQVVLEAQAAGLPVVVRDRGGPRELVRHGVTGFVAPDDAVFVRRVRELVDNPELRRRMGAAARDHARAMPGWTEVVDDLLGRLGVLARGGYPPPGSGDSMDRAAKAM